MFSRRFIAHNIGGYSIYIEMVNVLCSIEFKGEPDDNMPKRFSLQFYSSESSGTFRFSSLLNVRNFFTFIVLEILHNVSKIYYLCYGLMQRAKSEVEYQKRIV